MRSLLTGCLLVATCSYAQVPQPNAQIPQRYELVKLGPEVNTFYHEAAPVISPNGKDLYFFIPNHPENTHGKENSQDIWVSHKGENGWSKAVHAGSPLNKNTNNQVFTILPDGSLFIRGGRGKDEIGFTLVSPAGKETELDVQDFKDMMRGRFYGATISSDKKQMILYFSEAVQSIKSDLYVSHALEDNKWSRPVKLNITDGNDEYGPFLSPDDKILYYASDRADKDRVGASDIYKVERTDNTWNKWTKPQNLKKPINTVGGDAYFTVDAEGHVYTCRANARIDGGNFDIYVLVPKNIKITLAGTVYNMKSKAIMPSTAVTVTVQENAPLALKSGTNGKYESIIPESLTYSVTASAPGFLPYTENYSFPHMNNDTTLVADIYLTPVVKPLVLNGTVFDAKTKQPVDAKVEIISRTDKKSIAKLDAAGGQFSQGIPKLGLYVLTASADGYLVATDSILVNDEEVTPVTKDLYLPFVEVGLTVELKNVYFDYNKTTLKSESFVELDKVYDFLNRNPRVEVEIAGHTDNVGTDQYNATLSQGRCQSVVDYLISKGIAGSRLTPHGYGESKPIDTNDTEEGRANNRRVEVTVLKN